ncbi:MAG: NADH-quinone oxidoreductase subunit A [Puniceicoccaceae bacterium]|nr:MAG: NADH-quinone oxidoreductase subunit A [Puniceicoccaceae bacterium]
MELTAFLPVLVQILLAAGLALVIVGASHLFGQRSRGSAIKNSAYECGIPSDGRFHTRFSVKFYVTAMLFILFDVEVLFLIPLVFVYQDFLAQGISILLPILFFIGLLGVGLLYEIRKGALDWER